MRESPLVRLVKVPWWLNLMIGLGLMSLGELLKRGQDGPFMPLFRPFGDGLQVLSVFFVVLAMASFLIGAGSELTDRGPDALSRVDRPPAPHQPRPQAQPAPQPRPGQRPAAAPAPAPAAPPKKKYTERDFMPPAMRAELAAKERKEDE